MEDHTNNDCLWVTVMSHGSIDGKISSADQDYSVDELWKNFLGENCKSLIGKPKLFFIQACRGDLVDPGAEFDEADDHATKKNLKIPSSADFLVMYSTAEGNISYRNPTDGTWFIQALCKEFKLNSSEDLMRILIRVNRKVAFEKISKNEDTAKNEKKQMPQLVTMLTKSIYFSCNSSIPIKRVLLEKEVKNINVTKMTGDLCYDTSNANQGIALIFIDGTYSYSLKDGENLKAALEELQFDVRVFNSLKLNQLKEVLKKVSKEDHTNNDCLLITVSTYGKNTGLISASDYLYKIEELWKNFVGENCKSLIGKPKLVFIGANRGDLDDFGVSLKQKETSSVMNNNSDKVDSINMMQVIPSSADLLVMYSTTEGHSSFQDTTGSWFIQALCEELKANNKDNLVKILTRVNRRVAFGKQSKTPDNSKMDAGKQMPNFESTLTKSIYLSNNSSPSERDAKELCYDFTNVNRGVALIFNHEVFSQSVRRGTQKNGDDLKAVLKGLKFDVRYYLDLTLNQIKEVLQKVSKEDHTNNDCLWVTIMSHGSKDGKISATDKYYFVHELWENFVGTNCKSLIGKPKLFFIQASRGDSVDPGASLKSTQLALDMKYHNLDQADILEPTFVIPSLADLLVMYSTAKGHATIQDTTGSWFIQDLCKELKTNPHLDLLSILTGVNRRVAFERIVNPNSKSNIKLKQMPTFSSMLTKTMFFPLK